MAIVNSSAYSYGTNTFGSDAYGVDVLPAVASVAASVTVAIARVRFGSASVASSSSVSAIGGFTASASAIASGSSAASVSATRVRQGVNPANGIASVTANAVADYVSGGVSAGTSVITSVGEKFILELSSAFAYGTGNYGLNVYDYADFQTVVSATSVNSWATGGIIKSGSATALPSASMSDGGEITRVREGYSNPQGTATTTATAVYSIVVSLTIGGQSTVTASNIRKRNASSAIAGSSLLVVNAREKWESFSIGSTTWTPIEEASNTWTKIAA
jgi:hypothetical protein